MTDLVGVYLVAEVALVLALYLLGFLWTMR